MTALEDGFLQCPAHPGRAWREMWWRSGGSVVLTAPRSLAVSDSSVSPLSPLRPCSSHLGSYSPSPCSPLKGRRWVISAVPLDWEGQLVFVVRVSENSTITSLGQASRVRSWEPGSVCVMGQGNRYREQRLVKVLGL